jgi:MFS family permease
VWAVNTGIIVLGQIFVINRLIGKSRTKLFAAVAVLWAASWSIVGYGVNIQRAFLGAVIGVAVFAIGEMIWSTVGPTLTNDLAPEHLRGRYNSLDGLIWVSASAIGPAISGFMLQNNLVYQWIGMMMIGLLISGYFGLRMRKYLTPEQDGILVSN